MNYSSKDYVYFLIYCTTEYVALDLDSVEYGLLEDAAQDTVEPVEIKTLVNKRLLDMNFIFCSKRGSWIRKEG